jgi:hypothetical protein
MTGPQPFAFDDDDDDDLPEAVRKAQEAVAALADNFTDWMKADLDSALESLSKAKETAPDNASHVGDIYAVCHNIKGQGGSFGYGLITDVGKSLCDYIHEGGSASERKLKVVEAHLTAIKFIIDRDIQGDGGDVGKQLQAKLQALTQTAD